MSALVWHAWLLLTFRHDGAGMPAAPAARVALLLLTVAASVLRWGDPKLALAHGAVVLLAVPLSPPIALAYALLSTGIDVLAIPVESAFGSAVTPWFGIWELAGILALAARYHFGRRAT